MENKTHLFSYRDLCFVRTKDALAIWTRTSWGSSGWVHVLSPHELISMRLMYVTGFFLALAEI